MMKYALCEWERNGYNDSDFFVAEWDDEAKTVSVREVGSTRYAGGIDAYEKVTDPRMVDEAEAWLAERLFIVYRAADDRAVAEPDFAPNGERMRLLRNCKHKGVTYPAGTVGTAFYCDAFGQFYRNGYKTKNRFNLRVGLKLDDGSKIFVALDALRLDREPVADDMLREQAKRNARSLRFTEFFGGAWVTYDYASAARAKATEAA